MPTDKYYENLFTKPLVLTEKESGRFLLALARSYKMQRRKTIADTIQDVMVRLGYHQIGNGDRELIRICYLAANSKTPKDTELCFRKMYKSVFNAMRASRAFRPVTVDEPGLSRSRLRYRLVTAKIPCNCRLGNGKCGIDDRDCGARGPELCPRIMEAKGKEGQSHGRHKEQ